MFYAVTSGVFGVVLIGTAWVDGGAAYGLVWPAVSFLVVAAGYVGLGAGVFGKRADGGRAWWARVVLGPYLGFAWVVWLLRRWVVGDGCGQEIVPGIWLGRRPGASELPEGIECVVDLTCEFGVARGVAEGRRYVCLPVLDTRAPGREEFVEAVKRVAGCSERVYVHCAAGDSVVGGAEEASHGGVA